MAYGQTGTGKTFTLGRLGEEDTSCRGIMVRSMEDILTNISPESDSISVSYLQVLGPYINVFCSIICLINGFVLVFMIVSYQDLLFSLMIF